MLVSRYRDEILQLDFIPITCHALSKFTNVDLIKDAFSS